MNKEETNKKLHNQIANCRNCSLYKTAIHAVPGEGNLDADIMFVGEAPGRQEDETGRPFIGRAGKLLTELLKSIGLTREEVYITSIIKHRPPKNRAPKTREIRACKHWLDLQLEIIRPKLIVPLGRFGMEYFLPDERIVGAHGKLFTQKKWQVFPVYHPAYGLRGTKALAALQDDFKVLKGVIYK